MDLSKSLPLLWMVHNTVPSAASPVQEDRHAAVILQWEGSGDHLPHKMRPANEKERAQPHHTYSGIFHRDHRSGRILQIFGWLTVQKCFTDNEVHSQMVWEHLASLQYHHLSLEAILNLEQFSQAWKQVALSYVGVGFYLGLWYAVQCSSMLAVWKEVPAGTSELMSEAARGGPEVSESPPLPFHFSMRLLFTCKTWSSPPCSNHTLKTGTPCTPC